MDIVKNPAMGGAYAYGKSRHAYRDDGTLLAPEERWRVLKPGRHDGYVSWPEWLEVQETLAANSTIRERNRGAAREGAALLPGPRRLRPLRPIASRAVQQGAKLLLQPAYAISASVAAASRSAASRSTGSLPAGSGPGVAGRCGGGAGSGAGGRGAGGNGVPEPAAGA